MSILVCQMTSTSNNDLVAAAFGSATPSPTGWYRAPCPLCLVDTGKEDRRRSLGIRIGVWKWHCFRCGNSGKLPYAPTGVEEADLPEVEPVDPAALNAPDGFLTLADGDGFTAQSFEPARVLLRKRRVSREICREVGIGATLSGKAAYRVIVPVKGGREWLGWVGRSWCENSPLRYLYPRGMQRGELLFNSAALQVETQRPAVIVEGVFDALPHWPHAVACLGKPTDDQFEIMLAARRPLVVALDGDAWREGRGLTRMLNRHFRKNRAYFLRLPPLVDPGDLTVEDLSLRIREIVGYKEKLVSNIPTEGEKV